jgi:hypothetical protein
MTPRLPRREWVRMIIAITGLMLLGGVVTTIGQMLAIRATAATVPDTHITIRATCAVAPGAVYLITAVPGKEPECHVFTGPMGRATTGG